MRVSVSEEEMNRLIAYPIPISVIGVDTILPYRVYILAALPTGPDRLATFPTTHELNTVALGALYDEVLHFWQAHPTPFIASRFV